MQKRQKQSIGILIGAVLLYFANNAYHGWNMQPQGPLEGIIDFLVWVLMLLSFLWKPLNTETTNIHYEFIAKDGKIGFESKRNNQ